MRLLPVISMMVLLSCGNKGESDKGKTSQDIDTTYRPSDTSNKGSADGTRVDNPLRDSMVTR
jgi:hypothetical protein